MQQFGVLGWNVRFTRHGDGFLWDGPRDQLVERVVAIGVAVGVVPHLLLRRVSGGRGHGAGAGEYRSL
jgi:hypothetical protein